MFLGGFITSIALLAYLSTFGFMDMSVATVQHLALVAAAATVLESLPINTVIDDNISVPIFVYAMGYFIL
jgi:dolichol kinase